MVTVKTEEQPCLWCYYQDVAFTSIVVGRDSFHWCLSHTRLPTSKFPKQSKSHSQEQILSRLSRTGPIYVPFLSTELHALWSLSARHKHQPLTLIGSTMAIGQHEHLPVARGTHGHTRWTTRHTHIVWHGAPPGTRNTTDVVIGTIRRRVPKGPRAYFAARTCIYRSHQPRSMVMASNAVVQRQTCRDKGLLQGLWKVWRSPRQSDQRDRGVDLARRAPDAHTHPEPTYTRAPPKVCVCAGGLYVIYIEQIFSQHILCVWYTRATLISLTLNLLITS